MEHSLITTKIDAISSHAEGVARLDGYTLFVEGALPGETVQVRIEERRARFGKASLQQILEPSTSRVTPVCPVAGECGGCSFMHIDYQTQLMHKEQRVRDAITRIGHLDGTLVEACLPSPSALHYRNKVSMPIREVEGRLEIGFHKRNNHAIVPVNHCYIHHEVAQKVYTALQPHLKGCGLSAYDPRTHRGYLRELTLKSSFSSGEVLVVITTNEDATHHARLEQWAKALFPSLGVVGVVHHNHKTNRYQTIIGKGHISETVCGLTFQLSSESFFQVNPIQAERLYESVVECAALTGNETVLDAFCGTGTLSLLLAKQAREVIGVEIVAEAVNDARKNAKANNISNARFVTAPVEHWVKSAPKVDLLVMNPPRTGCAPTFLATIPALKPTRIVYVSCDPATLARDLKIMVEAGWRVDRIKPIDMFPQTPHVETVVSLSRK